jgi:hypothetical protein
MAGFLLHLLRAGSRPIGPRGRGVFQKQMSSVADDRISRGRQPSLKPTESSVPTIDSPANDAQPRVLASVSAQASPIETGQTSNASPETPSTAAIATRSEQSPSQQLDMPETETVLGKNLEAPERFSVLSAPSELTTNRNEHPAPSPEIVTYSTPLATPLVEKSHARTAQMPAPTQVRSSHQPVKPEMLARLTGRNDSRVPEPLKAAPRVEFAVGNAIVSPPGLPLPSKPESFQSQRALASRPHADTAQAARPQADLVIRREPKRAPYNAKEEAGLGTATKPVSAATQSKSSPAVSNRSALALQDPSTARPSSGMREEPRHSTAGRGQSEGTVNIKRIDIQIVNEEPRKTVRPRSSAAGDGSIAERLDRHYVRDFI